MDGWKTDFLWGKPIFRGELLAYNLSLYRPKQAGIVGKNTTQLYLVEEFRLTIWDV